MKTLFPNFYLLLLLSLTNAGPAEAAPPPRPAAPTAKTTPTPDEQLFTKLIEELAATVSQHDMKTLGSYMAPEYIHYNPNGSSGHKDEELAYLATWPPTTTMKLVGPVAVNRYGNTAVTVAKTMVNSTDKNNQPTSNTIQMMIVWVLRDGHWQMAVVQSKPVQT